MTTCTEFAVFTVAKADIEQVVALSESLFSEINATEQLITAHQILHKIDHEEEICWQLTWASIDAVKATTAKWQSFPSAKPLEKLVGKKHYYGHFVTMIVRGC
ncbi:MAG: hypothetical protein V5789_12785 [Colwellia sp.]